MSAKPKLKSNNKAKVAQGNTPPVTSKANASAPRAAASGATKIDGVIALLRRPDGASLAALMEATGWQAHSVRGAIAGSVKQKLGCSVASARVDGVRIYRVAT